LYLTSLTDIWHSRQISLLSLGLSHSASTLSVPVTNLVVFSKPWGLWQRMWALATLLRCWKCCLLWCTLSMQLLVHSCACTGDKDGVWKVVQVCRQEHQESSRPPRRALHFPTPKEQGVLRQGEPYEEIYQCKLHTRLWVRDALCQSTSIFLWCVLS